MHLEQRKFDLDDILIVPQDTTINSRSQIECYYKKTQMLPLICAPMDTVCEESNLHYFYKNGIEASVPRTICDNFSEKKWQQITKMGYVGWIAVGINTFKKCFVNKEIELFTETKLKIILDIANGHMLQLTDLINKAKQNFPNLVLMVGNIANPKSYFRIARETSVDYIRLSIGTGNACLTTQHLGVGYPIGSLLYEINVLKQTDFSGKLPKIVVDGGMKNYSDIFKSLVLGADYVMLGSILNKALESAGHTFAANKKIQTSTDEGVITIPGNRVNQYSEEVLMAFNSGATFNKKFRGMSTKEVQKHLGKTDLRSSEGVERIQKVEYTISSWVENFKDYMSSMMSYCNVSCLEDLIGKPEFILISENSKNRFKK